MLHFIFFFFGHSVNLFHWFPMITFYSLIIELDIHTDPAFGKLPLLPLVSFILVLVEVPLLSRVSLFDKHFLSTYSVSGICQEIQKQTSSLPSWSCHCSKGDRQ